MAEFIKWQNRYRRELGLPTETPPVCLNTVGKRVYDEIRLGLSKERKGGSVLTIEGERQAVVGWIVRNL